MGRQIMVCGSNRSGKSLFAEKLIGCTQGKRYYIATMIRSTEDNLVHIQKHIKQREGLNFTTLEMPFGFEEAEIEADSVVLLEDASNLLANLMFEKGLGAEKALEEIAALREKCGLLVIVSIWGLSTQGYEGETARYINALNEINQRIVDCSDAVIELKNSVPTIKKGEIGFADKVILDSCIHI